MGGLIIRPATHDDLAAIGGIQGKSSWQPKDYLDFDCTVAIENELVIAFLATRETTPGEHEILFLAVDPAHRRQGIARALLQNQIESQSGDWFLEVRASNTPAISLYESVGFTAVGTRPDYYSEPPETAIVMRFFS